jgi:hypothetical protein
MVRISVLNDTLKVGDYECSSCELHATRRRKWSRLAVHRALVSAVDFRVFFLFSLLLLLSFALSAEPREGAGGGFLETFSTPLTNDDCDVTTAFRDASVKGWLSKSTRRLPREKSF